MSKNKQKGKKEDLEGFDLKKENEILKKLEEAMAAKEKAEEEEEEEEEEIPKSKPVKQNLFSSNMFQKAQEQEVKKAKKKKKAKEEAENKDKDKNSQDKKEGDTPKKEEEANGEGKGNGEKSQEGQEGEEQEDNGQEEEEYVEEEFNEEGEEKDILEDIRRRNRENETSQRRNERREKAAKSSGNQKSDKAMEEEKANRLWHFSIAVLLILMTGFLFYSKYNQEKYQKMKWYSRGETMDEDLYELLEIDSSATTQDIKKQFKKMAIACYFLSRHPDKNPGCGQTCNEKFDKIHKAYEILSDPNKRKNYDENVGLFSPIKSKTVSLTMSNYKRLVEDSNDIWIIEVYEDGNPMCISIADLWDMVAKSYGGIIKFGRVNAMTQPELVARLPYHIALFPTIMALVPGNYPDIFTWSRYGLELALKKFIESNIINFINPINNDSFMEKWGKGTKDLKSNIQRKSEIIHVTNSDVTQIFYKYAAFQLHDLYDFYQNTFGEANKIRKSLERSKLDFVINVDHLKDENREDRYERDTYYFQLIRGPVSDLFSNILEFVKFNSVPELDKHLYAEFCGGSEGFVKDENDVNFDDDLKPSICILLLQSSANNNELQKQIYEIQKYQKVKSQELYLHIVNDEPLFENYHQFRFGIVDLDRHKKFQKIMDEFAQKNEHNRPIAFAYIHENGKYFTCEKSVDLVDFLEKIEKNDDTLEAYYTNQILGPNHLNDYLLAKNENVFTVFYSQFKANLSDIKLLAALVVVAIMNKVLLKKKFGASVMNGFTLYFLISLALSVFITFKELF